MDRTIIIIRDLLYEACWDEERKMFDTRCISVYEEAAEHLAKCGMIVWDENNGRYFNGERICRFYKEVEDDSSIV